MKKIIRCLVHLWMKEDEEGFIWQEWLATVLGTVGLLAIILFIWMSQGCAHNVDIQDRVDNVEVGV